MPDDAQLLTALTTEHFGLAGARSQAAGESASRSALYLGSVSSALIGLGLTAQLSKGGEVLDDQRLADAVAAGEVAAEPGV